MKKNVNAILDLQISVSESGMKDISEDMNSLKLLALDIGTAFSNTWSSVSESLESARISVDALTGAIETTNATLTFLMEQLAGGEMEDSIWNITDTVMNGLSLIVTILESDGVLGGLAAFGGAVGTAFAKICSVIGSAVKWLVGALSSTGGVIALIVAAIIAVVAILVAGIVQHWDSIKAAIGTAAEWINTNVIQPVVGFFTELWKSITGIVSGIWDGVVSVVSGAAQWFYDNVISPVMEIFCPIVEWYAQLFRSIWQTVSDVFHNIGVIVSGCWDVIVAVWSIVSSWFNDNVIQPVVSFFSGLWSSITAFASDAWTAIQNTFQAVGTWFYQNVIAPVAGFFSGLWDGFKKAAANAWEGVKSVFSAVGNIFVDITEYYASWSSKAAAL